MRAAIYARYSSDLQRDTSLEGQIAVAKRYATERQWTVSNEHIYSDAGISGASIQNRPSVQRLLAAAGTKPKAFDVLLVDDSSRIARDIPDAIRVMQTLKFLGVRVIYISQGIDSDSEQADALVAVHGLIDSLYLKELAKKVQRGLIGQHERGFATGSKTYGYRTIPVPDASGRKDPRGQPVLEGYRIEVDPPEADVVRQIFEWAADGVGLANIVSRLNVGGIAGSGGKRWTKAPISRVLQNERYLGRQIWGQRLVERAPGTGRKFMRSNPREEWRVQERPDLRILSDELWQRAHATRAAVRTAVAPKGGLARGKAGKYHSRHLFSGFAKCHTCGGAMTSVSGGKGSPRFGCRRSWNEGRDACPNRVTIRIKVAEPLIVAKLQAELRTPKALDAIVKGVEREAKRVLSATSETGAIDQQLLAERRKLQNLVSAIEAGGVSAGSLVSAVGARERNIAALEARLRHARTTPDLSELKEIRPWVDQQLEDLVGVLKNDPIRVKAEFRRLNLQLQFRPVEAEPRPHFVVTGQCGLSALVFLFLRRRLSGAVLDRSRGGFGPEPHASCIEV